MNLTNQKKFYNQYWENPSFINKLRLQRCIAILEAISQLHLLEPKIIDLGCGTGWLSSMLGHIGPTIGVDFSEVAIQTARKRYPYVQFTQADLLSWSDAEENYFDVVISQEVIEHFEDQQGYLDLAYRLLKNGGFLVLTTPNARTFNAMPEAQRNAWASQPIEKLLTVAELKHMLESSNFEICSLTTLIPSYGTKGIYRLFASQRLKTALRTIRLEKPFNQLRLSLGFGLHLLAVGKKVER